MIGAISASTAPWNCRRAVRAHNGDPLLVIVGSEAVTSRIVSEAFYGAA
jgi:hypothetical protein